PGERWLGTMRQSRGGFSVNGRESRRSPFSNFGGFFDDLPEGFRPTPKRVLPAQKNGRRLEYWDYTFVRTFVGERVGEYSFGPASVKGTFAVRVDSRGQLEGEPIYSFVKPVTIRVKDVPTRGRPTTYTGAVGRFEIGADVSPRKAKVGDPLTLTVWLRGRGTLDDVRAPELEAVADFANHFKIYEATEETHGDTRRFTYSLRPKDADTVEVPSISLAYFDVESETFVTLQTDSLPIQVTEASRLSSDEIALVGPGRTAETSFESREEGVFANVTDLRELQDETVHPDRWLLSLSGLTVLFFVVALATQRVQYVQSDTSLQRRRGAAAQAKRRLHAAETHLAAGNVREGVEGIGGSFVELVAATTDATHGVLTSTDTVDRLRELKVDAAIVTRVDEVMQACDHARYGAADGSLDGLPERAANILIDLVRALKDRRLLS
ncbi:MAG: BatD family protein, partial [Myxococcota bacterium]